MQTTKTQTTLVTLVGLVMDALPVVLPLIGTLAALWLVFGR